MRRSRSTRVARRTPACEHRARAAPRASVAAARPPKRKIGLTLALLLMGLTLVAGVIVGYASRGASPPAKLVTQTRTVPVVTVTVPAAP